MAKAFERPAPHYAREDTEIIDVNFFVQEGLRDDMGGNVHGIEMQIAVNRKFLGFLADKLVQSGHLDPKDVIDYFGWSASIKVVETE